MEVERLKELRKAVFEDFQLYEINTKQVVPTGAVDDVGKDIISLIDEAITRQIATSEDVAEAIYQMNEALGTGYLESDGEWTCYNEFSTNAIRTAITALQAYQPWTPVSERLPEEYRFVLISILNGKATGVGMIDKKKRWHGIDCQEMDITPEAWKPLPEPLK